MHTSQASVRCQGRMKFIPRATDMTIFIPGQRWDLLTTQAGRTLLAGTFALSAIGAWGNFSWIQMLMELMGSLPHWGGLDYLRFAASVSGGIGMNLGLLLLLAKNIRVFGGEKMIISASHLTIERYSSDPMNHNLFRLLTCHRERYPLSLITNLRLAQSDSAIEEALEFQCGTKHCRFGRSLNIPEAEYLFRCLSDFFIHHTHSVTCVVFGSPGRIDAAPSEILQNPEPSSLHTPLYHLQKIIIDAERYNLQRVEEFITYAINTMSREYLREEVVVQVYGDRKKLHPNIHNTLTNLCKHVYLGE